MHFLIYVSFHDVRVEHISDERWDGAAWRLWDCKSAEQVCEMSPEKICRTLIKPRFENRKAQYLIFHSLLIFSTVELARTCIGTPYYLSPEICENKPYNNKRY